MNEEKTADRRRCPFCPAYGQRRLCGLSAPVPSVHHTGYLHHTFTGWIPWGHTPFLRRSAGIPSRIPGHISGELPHLRLCGDLHFYLIYTHVHGQKLCVGSDSILSGKPGLRRVPSCGICGSGQDQQDQVGNTDGELHCQWRYRAHRTVGPPYLYDSQAHLGNHRPHLFIPPSGGRAFNPPSQAVQERGPASRYT